MLKPFLPQIIIAAVALAMIVIEARRWRVIDQIEEPKRRPVTSKSSGTAPSLDKERGE